MIKLKLQAGAARVILRMEACRQGSRLMGTLISIKSYKLWTFSLDTGESAK